MNDIFFATTVLAMLGAGLLGGFLFAFSNVVMVIMDVHLAGQRDGIETAVIIRRRYDIPSLFATAQPESELGDRAEASRPCGWLKKPFQPHQLVDAVRLALRA
jgi:two-component system, response regulator PdtaR